MATGTGMRGGALVVAGTVVLAVLAGCSSGHASGAQTAVAAWAVAAAFGPPTPPTPAEGVVDATASPVPVWVLVGGALMDRNLVYADSQLATGEIVIVPQAPLRPATTYRVSVVALTGSPAAEVYNASWTFTTSALAATDGGMGQATALAELNAFRAAAGVAAVSGDAGYDRAAALHAGYQRLALLLTHEEDPPPPANRCFVDRWFWNRISLAQGGTTWDGATLPVPAGFTPGGGITPATMRLAERVVAGGDRVAAVAELWNGVYQRLPLIRYDTLLFGSGHSVDAAAFLADPDPAELTADPAYATALFGGDTSLAQTTGRYPGDGASGVPRSFLTDRERPDPIGEVRTSPPPNATPEADWAGAPIHLLLPVTVDFSGLVVTLAEL